MRAFHTPGPWEAERDVNVQGMPCWRIESQSVRTLAALTFTVTKDADGFGKKNALLIQAAPEMLEALKDVLTYIMRAQPPGAYVAANKLTAMIKKAEGRR